ncbi:MAG TPA: M48 family metallopeptidase [Candidatus Acidoferrales bacterium]|nr:M48 family metallopeptidase [Candidatus Acidoferrales bacterium]
MKRSFASQWMASLVAAALIIVPATVTAQSQTPTPQQAPPQSQQSPAPAGQPTPPTTQAPSAPQTQSAPDPSGQSSSANQTVPQPSSPNVKSGSEADVDAIGNRKVGHGPELYSLEHDIAIGKQLSQEVEKSAKFIDDPVVIEYVNRVGQNLVRNSDAKVPFTIKVIDSDVVNAFALPGGFFYVNSGLILHADEESELAGVMAHEIAHVCARHGTRQESKSTLVQLASIPAMIFIPYSWAGYAIYQGMNFAIPLTFLKFSRADEAEADYLGLQYMYKAGYDPNSFVSFFEKVQADEKKQPGTIPKVFSTHPPTPDRIEAIQKEIATILPARDQYIVSTSEFDTVKARLQMIEQNIKVKDNNPNKPTLRKKTAQNKGGNTAPPDPNSTSTSSGGNSGDTTSDDSDRPTLKHRTDDSDPNNPSN